MGRDRTRPRKLHAITQRQGLPRRRVLPKKEVIKHMGEIAKLEKYLGGVKEMKKLPGALFIVDTRNAITQRQGLPRRRASQSARPGGLQSWHWP